MIKELQNQNYGNNNSQDSLNSLLSKEILRNNEPLFIEYAALTKTIFIKLSPYEKIMIFNSAAAEAFDCSPDIVLGKTMGYLCKSNVFSLLFSKNSTNLIEKKFEAN